jgi:hypothetical protein
MKILMKKKIHLEMLMEKLELKNLKNCKTKQRKKLRDWYLLLYKRY